MALKWMPLLVLVISMLLLTACVRAVVGDTSDTIPIEPGVPGNMDNPDNIDIREQLLSMGYTDELLDSLESDGVNLLSIYNQMRFNQYIDRLNHGRPIGRSGMVIAPEYFGGIYYDDIGILTVVVLDEAYSDASSVIAIIEMQELGIIVKSAVFTEQELIATIEALNQISDRVSRAGATGWGLDTIRNTVYVYLDPYTDEQIAIFMDLLRGASINPAMITIKQAITQEMVEYRKAFIAAATESNDDRIVVVGEVEVDSTSIVFTFENREDLVFFYGAQWDMAYYSDGNWAPVQHLPGAGGGVWIDLLYSMQGGETKLFEEDWEWRFGQLPPGRYMYIRNGYFDGTNPASGNVFATAEFIIG